jgi:TolB-like protein
MSKPSLARAREVSEPAVGDRLDSWKEIASYLGRDIRTVYRWEIDEALPVYRHLHKKRGTVYSYRSELDIWRTTRGSRQAGSVAQRVMLAVLPFANLSSHVEDDYFSDGLTEEVLAQLGRLHPECLGIIARTSVMQYKGTRKAIDQIGYELGVDYVLEGSVRQIADRVRVTAQLIKVRDQTHLWAECYERDLRDVLLLQSEIAQAIAREIHVTVTPEGIGALARARRVNPEAYQAYLKGRFHWYKLSREHLDVALEYFQLAREKDPEYALAYVGIGCVWLSRGDCGLVPPRQAFPLAKAAALKALELDATLTEVHELLGNVRRHFDWDWKGAETAFKRAIQLNPNHADGHFMYSDFLISMERFDEATTEMTRALALDPLNFLFHCFLGWHLVYLRRYDEAIAKLVDTVRTEPAYPAAHLGLWGAYYQKRMYDDALAEAQRFFDLVGDSELAKALRQGYEEAGYTRGMRMAAELLVNRSGRPHVPAVRIARLYAHAGESDRALDWLEKACEEREPPLVHLRVAWDWDNLRGHHRFRDLLRRMDAPE